MLSIGGLSRQCDVKVPTIRYYEDIGLMPKPERNAGNQRRYGDTAVDRLRFVKHARELGFSIHDIRALIALDAHPEQPCHEATQIARNQRDNVRKRLAQLQALEAELTRIAEGCDNTGGACYVLKSLENHGMCEHTHHE